MELLKMLFTDYTLRTVAGGTAVVGLLSGVLGVYAVLRRQSLLGDAISHAALPGIAFAFLLTGSKAPLVLLIGAALSGWFGTYLIHIIIKNSRIKSDGALGLILSVFFGLGLMILTFIQKRPDASQSGLDHFLFGQAATLLQKDALTMAGIALIALIIIGIYWKEFKLLSFDKDYGYSLGFSMRYLDLLMTTLLVVAIVTGLQTVGVVLMSSMIVAPAAAARQWTDRLSVMVFLSGFFGALSGVSGALVSSSMAKVPTGPAIVVCISLIALISFLLAPNRGLLAKWLRRRKNRQSIQLDAVLLDMLNLAKHHNDVKRCHPIETLRAMSFGHGGVDGSLRELSRQGLVSEAEPNCYILTEKGLREAEKRGK